MRVLISSPSTIFDEFDISERENPGFFLIVYLSDWVGFCAFEMRKTGEAFWNREVIQALFLMLFAFCFESRIIVRNRDLSYAG